jgi:hypothetical protein
VLKKNVHDICFCSWIEKRIVAWNVVGRFSSCMKRFGMASSMFSAIRVRNFVYEHPTHPETSEETLPA